ncbi:MAG: hypothetical protein J5769_07210 [Bacteroidales bacterium]|nr:hypothetical protein [Bacteroidales bacterium]
MRTNDFSASPERLFKEKGPYFHVCSKPVDGILFGNDQDRKAALVALALAASETSTILLAYAIMSNHFHVIIATDLPERFYKSFKERINRYLARHGRCGFLLPEDPTIVPIMTLNQLLNEIVYVIRNQYVVDDSVNPLSHVWCSGYLYFNPILKQFFEMVKYTNAADLSGRKIMLLTNSKETNHPFGSLQLLNEFPAPSSFVDYELVEKLFSSARQFTVRAFKNVEAQIETALILGEDPCVPDEEMSSLVWKYCKDQWGVDKMKQLTPQQRIALAKHMKYSYRSSNGQISRITFLPLKDVNTLFPLTAKKQP